MKNFFKQHFFTSGYSISDKFAFILSFIFVFIIFFIGSQSLFTSFKSFLSISDDIISKTSDSFIVSSFSKQVKSIDYVTVGTHSLHFYSYSFPFDKITEDNQEFLYDEKFIKYKGSLYASHCFIKNEGLTSHSPVSLIFSSNQDNNKPIYFSIYNPKSKQIALELCKNFNYKI